MPKNHPRRRVADEIERRDDREVPNEDDDPRQADTLRMRPQRSRDHPRRIHVPVSTDRGHPWRHPVSLTRGRDSSEMHRTWFRGSCDRGKVTTRTTSRGIAWQRSGSRSSRRPRPRSSTASRAARPRRDERGRPAAVLMPVEEAEIRSRQRRRVHPDSPGGACRLPQRSHGETGGPGLTDYRVELAPAAAKDCGRSSRSSRSNH